MNIAIARLVDGPKSTRVAPTVATVRIISAIQVPSSGAAGVAHVREASEGMQRLSELPLGTPTYVVNNVKYSAHVNALHPNKARFVEAVIENVRTQFSSGGGA